MTRDTANAPVESINKRVFLETEKYRFNGFCGNGSACVSCVVGSNLEYIVGILSCFYARQSQKAYYTNTWYGIK